MGNSKLVLVDGHSLAYRAFHALPPDLKNSKGELTNAVFGFTSMLLGVLNDLNPEYVIVTFDKGPSFRVRDYVDYKATRAHMPDEMRVQMERIREVVAALGIPAVDLDDFEADDLLGTLSRQGEAEGLEVFIVTGDRDALQLVSDHVTVITSGRRFSDTLRYTPVAVLEKYGLTPDQLIDLKALLGDTSDNIPGVSGVGEKGAIALLQQYGTLDEVYNHLDEIAARYRKALEEGKDKAYLSRHLATIVRDVPVKLDIQSARLGAGYNANWMQSLMRELEFRTLLDRLPETLRPAAALTAAPARKAGGQLSLFETAAEESDPVMLGDYRLVADGAALEALGTELRAGLAQAGEKAWLAIDTESTAIDTMQADLVGISLTDRVGTAWYLPVRAPEGEPVLPMEAIVQALGPLLADPAIRKVGHNLKYDLKLLRRNGLPMVGPFYDPMIAEWVLNPGTAALGLKPLAWSRLGVQMTEIQELIGRGKDQVTMEAVALRKVVPYASADADMTLQLGLKQLPELAERGQTKLVEELEMPLIPVLAAMEMTGVQLDRPYLEELSKELGTRLRGLEAEIYQLAGGPFNINSTQQLSNVLFERLKLSAKGVRKTQSGHHSTDAGTLERLQGEHPIVDKILEHRSLSKLKSTYVDALPQLINPTTGRVHTSFNQTGAVTGRLSSSDPNLQNIPIRTEDGRRVRKAFIAPEGWILVGADYSQVELRILAHISGDPGLLEAFGKGEDIHASTAAAVYGVPLAEVTKDQRRVAKAVNFGLMYGQTAYGLASQLGISAEEADRFIQRYFERFPKVHETMERIQNEAGTLGYVETLMGRRRYFPELAPGNKLPGNQRQAALRMAINAPIQGTAADIIKVAMLRLARALAESGLRARMILQVHDELVLEALPEELPAVTSLLREAMEGAWTLQVPLKVDVEAGKNWEEMEGI